MDGPLPTILLVLAADPASARHWTEILEGPQTTVWQRRPGPGDGRPDVIVTDLAEIEDRPGGDPAVVRIGNAGDGGKKATRATAAARAGPTCGCPPIAPRASWSWPVSFWPRSCGFVAGNAKRRKSTRNSPCRRSATR